MHFYKKITDRKSINTYTSLLLYLNIHVTSDPFYLFLHAFNCRNFIKNILLQFNLVVIYFKRYIVCWCYLDINSNM